MAAVAAVGRRVAEEAAPAVAVRYHPLPFVVDLDGALLETLERALGGTV